MISIIMPTHKNHDKLYITLYSVLSQSYKDWELVVVDSSDDKFFENWLEESFKNNDLLKPFKFLRNKIKIIKPTIRTDCPGAMYMEGFNNTTCGENDFVIFLDDDDWLANNLFENIYDISYKYPEAEMISSDYISPLFDGNKILKNIGAFDGVKNIAEHDKILICNFFVQLNKGFIQWRNFHDWKANLHPKILRKKSIQQNHYKIIEDTQCHSDCSFRIQSVVMKEVYILDVGFYFVKNFKKDSVGVEGFMGKRTKSDFAIISFNILQQFEKYLNDIKFKKDRIYYTPKNLNYKT